MTSFLDQLFNIQNYPSRATKENARLIYGFTMFMIVAFLLYAMFVTQGNGVTTLLSDASNDGIALLALLSVFSVGLLTLLCVRIGKAELAAIGPVVMWYFSGTMLGIQGHFRTSDEGAALLAFIFFCGLFLRARVSSSARSSRWSPSHLPHPATMPAPTLATSMSLSGWRCKLSPSLSSFTCSCAVQSSTSASYPLRKTSRRSWQKSPGKSRSRSRSVCPSTSCSRRRSKRFALPTRTFITRKFS